MICPGCNKFASYDEPETSVNDASIDASGNVTVEGQMLLHSACCNYELKSWEFLLENSIDHDMSEGEHELEVECDDVEGGDFYDNPGRPSRYRRHIYTVEATASVKCSCGYVEELALGDKQAASGFDELT